MRRRQRGRFRSVAFLIGAVVLVVELADHLEVASGDNCLASGHGAGNDLSCALFAPAASAHEGIFGSVREIAERERGSVSCADDWVHDSDSGMALLIACLDAPDVAASLVNGSVVYVGAEDAPALFQGVSRYATEDFVSFPSRPAHEVLRYGVELGATVAGLRLVAGTLEFLDASGTPRLRATAPYGIDATGARFTPELTVSGCAVDTSPVAPWNRPVTGPGARRCEVDVSWHDAPYPLMVDPAWMSTQVMNTARAYHGGDVLTNGQVLVTGGYVSNQSPHYTASAELYDPLTHTWAVTGSMTVPRGSHTETALSDGTALVTGGVDNGTDTARTSAEIYDPTTGGFTPVGALHDQRIDHTAARLQSGKVLVAGGYGVGQSALTSAELYDPIGQVWATTGDMPSPHQDQAMAVLADGRVLVAGGGETGTSFVATAALYDPIAGTWTSTPDMNHKRDFLTLTALLDGRALAAGGDSGGQNVLAAAELYDPMTNTWTATANMPDHREVHAAARLLSGDVLVVGGADISTSTTAAILWSPTTELWTSAGHTSVPHDSFPLVVLGDGTALAPGGANSTRFFLDECDLYTPPATNVGGGGSAATGGGGAGGAENGGGAATSSGGMSAASSSASASVTTGHGGSSGTCVPGQQTACACAGGAEGVQVCDATGDAFGKCTCGAGAGAGGGGDAAAGESGGGCGCGVAGDDNGSSTFLAVVFGACAIAARRRRRRGLHVDETSTLHARDGV
jgi:MYXO-CTERM domain-containing protein